MIVDILGFELGSISETVAALAAVAGSVLSIFALKFGLAANRTADQTRREAKDANDAGARREQARDAADLERDRRLIAGSLAAWWAADRSEVGRRYGVVVSNQSPTASVFYDVNVHVTGRVGGSHIIHLTVLPPGRFFIPQSILGTRATWDRIPLPVLASDVLDPFTVARDRSVDVIDYADGLGTRWRWSPDGGLDEVRSPVASASATGERVSIDVPLPGERTSAVSAESVARSVPNVERAL